METVPGSNSLPHHSLLLGESEKKIKQHHANENNQAEAGIGLDSLDIRCAHPNIFLRFTFFPFFQISGVPLRNVMTKSRHSKTTYHENSLI